MGFVISTSYFKGNHLSITALHDHCKSTLIDDDSSEVDVVKYSHCVTLMIIGRIMFSNYQGDSAKLVFLQILGDINRVKSDGWESGQSPVLAFLYRELCNPTRMGRSIIFGYLYILQVYVMYFDYLIHYLLSLTMF